MDANVRYELVASDGYSIERTIYDTMPLAQDAMKKAYDEFNKNEPGDEWAESSYIGNVDALLYDRGENVYVWSIFPYAAGNADEEMSDRDAYEAVSRRIFVASRNDINNSKDIVILAKSKEEAQKSANRYWNLAEDDTDCVSVYNLERVENSDIFPDGNVFEIA